MPGMSKLTEEVMAELSGKSVEDRRKALTALNDEGVNIIPYIKSMLKQGADESDVKAHGFNTTHYGSEFLVIYSLNNRDSFFYRKKSDGTYEPWPS